MHRETSMNYNCFPSGYFIFVGATGFDFFSRHSAHYTNTQQQHALPTTKLLGSCTVARDWLGGEVFHVLAEKRLERLLADPLLQVQQQVHASLVGHRRKRVVGVDALCTHT